MGTNRSAEAVAARRGRVVLTYTAAFAAYSAQACLVVAHHAPLTANRQGPSNSLMNIVIWALFAVIVTWWIYLTPGMLVRSAADRAVLNDELVRHERQLATRVALVVLVAGMILEVLGLWLFALPAWWPVAVLSAALVAGAVVFGLLDVRANG